MEPANKLQGIPRNQLLFGVYAQLRSRDRIARDERIDVPAIEESARVTFGRGTNVQPIRPDRSPTAQALALYQSVQQL